MQPTTKFSFIDSELPYKDAKELLTELFKYKINFHKVKNFSSIIRYDKTDVDSIQKIEELTKSRDAMMQYLESAKEENRMVTIFSDFHISIK